MVGESSDRFETVKRAELALLDDAIRRDPRRVRDLLHDDFVEIGRSGRRWTKEETIAALAEERDRVAPHTDEWAFVDIAPTLVLVTYRLTAAGVTSRHASLWDVTGAAPVIRYHQGTVLRSGDAGDSGAG